MSFYTDLCKIYTVHCIKPSALPVHSPVFFFFFFLTFHYFLTYLEFQISFAYGFVTIQLRITFVSFPNVTLCSKSVHKVTSKKPLHSQDLEKARHEEKSSSDIFNTAVMCFLNTHPVSLWYYEVLLSSSQCSLVQGWTCRSHAIYSRGGHD